MAQAKPNLLKMSDVKKKAKLTQTQEVYTLRDGSDIKFHPVFAETKIEELLIDLQVLLKEAELKEIEISDSLMYHMSHLLIIKHFTHLGSQIKGGFLDHVEFLNALRNGDYYSEIMNDVLPADQVQKVRDVMVTKMAESQIMENMMESVATRMQELKLKNKDVFEKIGKLGEPNTPLN